MRLLSYIKRRYGTAAQIGRGIGVSPVLISQWAHGVRPVPIIHALAIERLTEGSVRRWDLRPNDWHLIWPELVGTEGAPPIPTTETPSGAERP
jgi:DNA-binding transcriptional regulator YdaS (Cro superfamily)